MLLSSTFLKPILIISQDMIFNISLLYVLFLRYTVRGPKAQRGVEVYLYFFLTSTLEGMDGQYHAPAALTPGNTR
jgi:hypothetical protein